MNRMYTSKNPYQGSHKRVLCVCSAGLLRSPTAAWVLSNDPYNHNTRAAGLEDSYALVPVDEVLIHWSDEIVVMTDQHYEMLKVKARKIAMELFQDEPATATDNSDAYVARVLSKTKLLNIPDDFGYRDPTLIRLIQERYAEVG